MSLTPDELALLDLYRARRAALVEAEADRMLNGPPPAQLTPDALAYLRAVRRMVADDAIAMSHLTMGQYRTALLQGIDAAMKGTPLASVRDPVGIMAGAR